MHLRDYTNLLRKIEILQIPFTSLKKINWNNSVFFIQIITIKNSKTLKIIHDNKDQGSTLG